MEANPYQSPENKEPANPPGGKKRSPFSFVLSFMRELISLPFMYLIALILMALAMVVGQFIGSQWP